MFMRWNDGNHIVRCQANGWNVVEPIPEWMTWGTGDWPIFSPNCHHRVRGRCLENLKNLPFFNGFRIMVVGIDKVSSLNLADWFVANLNPRWETLVDDDEVFTGEIYGVMGATNLDP